VAKLKAIIKKLRAGINVTDDVDEGDGGAASGDAGGKAGGTAVENDDGGYDDEEFETKA